MRPTESQRASAGPLALKTPGTPEWCWQILGVLKEQMRHVAEQYDLAENALGKLREVKAWEKIPPGKPYGSLDAMLRAEVGLPAQTVRKRIAEARHRAMRAAQGLSGKTIHKGNSPVTGDNITSNETGKGTSAEYLARRIARDHPDVLARMEAGEFRSVRAAAIEAGIVKPTVIIRTDNMDAAARVLRRRLTAEQLAELARLLLGEGKADV